MWARDRPRLEIFGKPETISSSPETRLGPVPMRTLKFLELGGLHNTLNTGWAQ
jgi:hypothetical protein